MDHPRWRPFCSMYRWNSAASLCWRRTVACCSSTKAPAPLCTLLGDTWPAKYRALMWVVSICCSESSQSLPQNPYDKEFWSLCRTKKLLASVLWRILALAVYHCGMVIARSTHCSKSQYHLHYCISWHDNSNTNSNNREINHDNIIIDTGLVNRQTD